MARVAMNAYDPDTSEEPLHIETQYGEDDVPYHQQGITNKQGYYMLVPVGSSPVKMSFPNAPSVSSYSYDMGIYDLQVHFHMKLFIYNE